MKRETALAIADCCEALARALREESEYPARAAAPMKLTVAATEYGIPASTLRELVRRKEIEAIQTGAKRGWMVSRESMNDFIQRRTRPARPTSIREAAAH